MIKSNCKIKIIFIALFSSNILISQPAESLKNDSYTYLKSNLEFLASDELEGRETTTKGERLASLFISEELEKYGVVPFGENGTYFQEVPMIVSYFSPESRVVFSDVNQKQFEFINGDQIAYSARNLPEEKFSNKECEIIFAGYGIYSEEDNYDSYSDLNVEGKVVLILNGTPKKDGEEILGGSTVRKYSRSSRAKANLAKEKGALGLVILPDSMILRYWPYLTDNSTSKSFDLVSEVEGENVKENIPVVILNDTVATVLLKNESIGFAELSNSENPKPFKLNSKITLDYKIKIEKRNARNVIGLIKGNDKNLEHEYLTLGAHYDHEGIKNGEVYNGADDNGSGTVTILEVARQLALNKENERPVVVIFHTGEEKGLKGSKYLTENSKFVDSAIVHVNIDMVGRQSEDSIYCIGASKISQELGQLVEEVNSKTVNFILDYKFDAPNDPQRLYYRSDHVHYAEKGIPIVFYYDYMEKDYHKPTDTVDKINLDKMLRMSEYIYNLLIKISNLDHKLTVDELSTN